MTQKLTFNFVTAVLFAFTLNARAEPKTSLNDAQILAIVETANEGEVSVAREEKTHGKTTEVKDFAKKMIEHHSENNKEVRTLAKRLHIKPNQTATSKELHADAKATTAKMEKMKGLKLDQAYIDSQISMHERVLNEFDSDLIPQVKNEELKTLLKDTRSTVAMHLEEARELKKVVSANE